MKLGLTDATAAVAETSRGGPPVAHELAPLRSFGADVGNAELCSRRPTFAGGAALDGGMSNTVGGSVPWP